MLRDNFNTYHLPAYDDLSTRANLEIFFILDFIDRSISGFRPYYFSIKDSERENRISDSLVYYFNVCLLDEKSEGFPPFNFGKNPTQALSGKETDIGVVALTKNAKPITIIEFEAKRLSTTSNNKEYVCGKRGGIERFKRAQHASHLLVCGMFGYVQNSTVTEWISKINEWILELSQTNTDAEIDWHMGNEQLALPASFNDVEKRQSINLRKKPFKEITLFHYFINLS